MILMKAVLYIVPAHREPFLQALSVFVSASRNDAGCISFDTLTAVDNPNQIVVLAAWQDKPSLDQHEASAHVAAFKKAIRPLLAAKDPTVLYQIESVDML